MNVPEKLSRNLYCLKNCILHHRNILKETHLTYVSPWKKASLYPVNFLWDFQLTYGYFQKENATRAIIWIERLFTLKYFWYFYIGAQDILENII